MKNPERTLTCLLILIGLLSSCIDGGEISYTKWEILNQTDYTIKMTVLKNGVQSNTILLQNKGTGWESENLPDGHFNTNYEPIYSALNGDSLIIIFEDQRISYFGKSFSKFNILYEENYLIIHESATQYIHRYTFTNEDYENAEPIGEGG